MASIAAVFTLLIYLVVFLNFTMCILGKQLIKPRIINGELADFDEFKYAASLVMYNGNKKFYCGGALIHNEWVLTAAHCFIDTNTPNVTVYLGTIHKLEAPVVYVVQRQNIITHDKYDETNLYNDIALIRIPPVKFTEAINSIALPQIGSTIYIGSEAIAMGWGNTFVGQTRETTLLHFANFKIISNKECSKLYGPIITDAVLCTSSINNNSMCHGDSGSPLVLKSKNVLVGILIFSDFHCKPEYPNGFARITYYRDWIRAKTGLKL